MGAMTVQQELPKDGAHVLVNLNPWADDWKPAIARFTSEGTLRWRTREAGWVDAHPGDEWVESRMTEGT